MLVEQYPRDEFDELADERGLRGSHRRRRHWSVVLAPLLAALVFAPLAGWGVVELMSQDGMTNPFIAETTSTSAGESPTGTADEETSSDVTDDPDSPDGVETTEPAETSEPVETTEEPAIETLPPVDGVTYNASIDLMNGTGVAGGTDPTESTLLVAGYTAITSADFASTTPTYSAIYFSSPELYATAQHLAQTLNINFWAENAAMTGGADILIVIR